MPEQNIVLLVPGVPASRIPDPNLQKFLKLDPISGHDIVAPRRGETVAVSRTEGPPDSIVRVEYESGLVEYLRLDQFQAELGVSRSAGPARVPASLDRGAVPGRGVTEWVLKALDVFHVSPADAIAEASAELITKHFDDKLETGLFRLAHDGSSKEKIVRPLAADTRPFLIFIHGTASSTQGSFGGFWSAEQTKKPTAEWNSLLKTYDDRIFALEHATFSVSPARNALDLIAMLPENATLHVITHSRGGLVGELLGLGKLSDDDRKPFAGRPDAPLLDQLAGELDQKKLNVEKFVRTACPAAGTILASGRLDIYLNVMLNLIGLVPGLAENPFFDLFKATSIELIKMRADPEKIPGIEAQMPESPFIHLLNTRGRQSNADLGVIAGDFEGSGIWSTLASYALRAYYLEHNDFVVNTKSMSGGMDRKRPVEQFLDQGANVNHFRYFKNDRTRSKILEWLAAPAGADVAGFGKVRALITQGRGRPRGVEKPPVAVIVPDVFGTHLKRAEGDAIWLNYAELARGKFLELVDGSIAVGEALDVYQPLFDALSSSHQTLLFAYDWRQSIRTSAEELDKWLARNNTSAPVRFIGHGLGGLIVRQFAAANPQRWNDLSQDGGRLLMLGTPNGGSWNIARMLAGRSRLVRMLALLGRNTDTQVAGVLQKFQGLIDLLPEAMLTPGAWNNVQTGRPAPEALAASREWREQLANSPNPGGRMLYVAGGAPATPSSMDDYSAEGDGDTTHGLGIDSRIRTWFNSSTAHGDLISTPAPLVQLLATGATTSYDSKFQPSPFQPPPFQQRVGAAMDRQELLAREMAVLFPSEADLRDAALGRAETPLAKPEPALAVSVTHGHVREAWHLVMVGHYAGDGIVSAEAALDRAIGEKLSTRFHMDIYPGPKGTVEVVRAPDCHPQGAIVIGLGEVGEITAEKVRRGVLEGCLEYALMKSEEEGQGPRSAAISSVLIGASGGRALSIADSVTAIVRGALEANRVLKRRNLIDKVRVDEVEFVELYADAANEATRAVNELPEVLRNALEPGEQIAPDKRTRRTASGLSRQAMNPYSTGWWRRIQIVGEPKDLHKPAQRLKFENLTDRARAEESYGVAQTSLVNGLLETAVSGTSYDRDTAVALFELLVPATLKDQSAEAADLVLVVDPIASRYPWELMAERTRDHVSPLSVRMGIIRQLKMDRFRVGPRGAHDHYALVIGDPTGGDQENNLPELKGAQEEARQVGDLLTRNKYSPTTLIQAEPGDIIRAVFAQDYRILHLAGHGDYNPAHPERSGMILKYRENDLAQSIFLTAMELGQIRNIPELVFINCCHLGAIDRQRSPHQFAASISQKLIEIGVKAVVAAGWAVDDAAAVAFARSFYQSMLAGGKFGESVKRARADAFALGNNNTWGAYQCYGNPDFVLAQNLDGTASAPRVLRTMNDWRNELKDIAAESRGATEGDLENLKQRLVEAERNLGGDQDGESLFDLAEAYKSLGDFEQALNIYQEAVRQEGSLVPIKGVEQLSNVMDRIADRCYEQDRNRANKLWDAAEKHLTGLIELLGESVERLSLLGALYKRRGARDRDRSAEFFKKALDCYSKAYLLKEPDPYPGLNAIALAWISRLAPPAFQDECLQEAKRRRDATSVWDRIYNPDAMLLEFLIGGTGTEDEIVKAYNIALQHAAPNQKNSVTGQIQYLIDQRPDVREKLESILQKIV